MQFIKRQYEKDYFFAACASGGLSCTVPVFAADSQKDISLFLSSDTKIISVSDTGVEVGLNIADNPGIWAIRCYIVYPEKLRLEAVENGDLFADSCITEGIYDLPLSDSRQVDSFNALIIEEGIPIEGYRSVTVYFESDSIDESVSEDGVVADITFAFTDDAVLGETYEIKVYTGENDVINAYMGEDGMPVFTEYTPDTVGIGILVSCPHSEREALTDVNENGEACARVVCTVCKTVTAEAVLPEGASFARGDLNLDASINVADAVNMKKFLGGVPNPDELQMICSDVNGDGSIDSNILYRYIAGKISEL